MSFLDVKIHATVEAPKCVHCGGKPQLVIKMLDKKRSHRDPPLAQGRWHALSTRTAEAPGCGFESLSGENQGKCDTEDRSMDRALRCAALGPATVGRNEPKCGSLATGFTGPPV
jgi:hypothetical protein